MVRESQVDNRRARALVQGRMAVRVEFHMPQRRKGSGPGMSPPPGRLMLLILGSILGAHLLFWLTGILE